MTETAMQKFLRSCPACDVDETVFAMTRDDVMRACTNCNNTVRLVIDGPLWQPSKDNPFRLEDLVPLRDRVLVAPLPVPEIAAGSRIVQVETSQLRERPSHGIVLKVGSGLVSRMTGDLQRPAVKTGDCVFYGKYSGQAFMVNGREVLNMAESEIYSRLPAGAFILVEHDEPKLNHLFGDYCRLCATPEELAAEAALEAERRKFHEARIAAELAKEVPIATPEVQALHEKAMAAEADYARDQAARSALEEEREKARQARQAAEAQA